MFGRFRRKLPADTDSDTEDRFNRLLREMAKPVTKDVQTPSEEDQTSDEERNEGRGDIQTPTDTSEDAP